MDMDRKKILCLSLMVLLLMIFGAQAALAETADVPVLLNGEQLAMPASVRSAGIYLPVRAVCEQLGFSVGWSQENQTVVIDGADKSYVLDLQQGKIKAGDHEYYMSYPPEIIGNRTYLQEECLADSFPLKVRYDQTNNRVQLTGISENDVAIRTENISLENGLKAQVQYPVLEGLADRNVQDRINALFKEQAEQALQEGKTNAEELAPLLSENPEIPWRCETYFNYRVKYNQNGLLSVVLQNYQYAGGAHGSTVQTAFTVNLQDGRQYALQDLFQENADYAAVINRGIADQLELRGLTEALFEPFAGIKQDQSFYLSDNGIVVYFGQYEILPYAAGIQEFTIDYAALDGLWAAPLLAAESSAF